MRPFYANGVTAAYRFALAIMRLPHELTKSSAPARLKGCRPRGALIKRDCRSLRLLGPSMLVSP
jgi:hypothetical protein